jgi:hypothetical protein
MSEYGPSGRSIHLTYREHEIDALPLTDAWYTLEIAGPALTQVSNFKTASAYKARDEAKRMVDQVMGKPAKKARKQKVKA